MVEEDTESFPRGCMQVVKTPKKRTAEDDVLFQIDKPTKAKRSKTERNNHSNDLVTDNSFLTNINITGTLSYNKLQEGMQILGCIRQITNFSIEIELPGLIFTHVGITSISDSFTNVLQTKLREGDQEVANFLLNKIFKVGDFVPVKIVSIEFKEKNVHVQATLNPKHINADKPNFSFKKGMLIWGSIESVLEHGYVIDVGVKSCRVFLPSKNVDSDIICEIGKPMWCVIHKCDHSVYASTVRVSAKKEHLDVCIQEVTSLDDIIPGVKIELFTENVTKQGIQGKFLDKYFGYVDESQLKKPLDNVQKYNEGTLLPAYVLYIEPVTKITHLTLRSLQNNLEPSHSVGDVIIGEVFSSSSRGVYLKFDDGVKEKAFVTNKRLLKSLNKDANINDAMVQTKFRIGSRHNCRILDYSHLNRMYICTVEPGIVKCKYFVKGDLKLGQLVSAEIKEIKPEGFVVSVGHLVGFIPNLHICNTEFSEKIKQKFKVGTKKPARVFFISENGSIILTLKQKLIQSNACLTRIEDATVGNSYPGIIVQTTKIGARVIFYGNIKGFIHVRQLGQNSDPKKFFFRGQASDFKVLNVKNSSINLTIENNKKSGESIFNSVFEDDKKRFVELAIVKTKDLKLGQLVNVEITEIIPEGFIVSVGQVIGLVPNLHICNSEFSDNFKNDFKVGMKKPARVFFISESGNVVFTFKEKLINSDACLTKIKNAKVGSCYPGTIVRIQKNGAHVDFYGNVKGYVSLKDLGNLKIKPKKLFFKGQTIDFRVLRVKKNSVVRLTVDGIEENNTEIAVDDLNNSKGKKKRKKSAKTQNLDSVPPPKKPKIVNQECENEITEIVSVLPDVEDIKQNSPTKTVKDNPKPILPGISTFFNNKEIHSEVEESSDEEQESNAVTKKKKLSAAERAELLRAEEENISKIEKELMDGTANLQSADQFERQLLANPNSSILWTKFMALYISATELDKARSVAKRALETINFTLEQERLNIWLALLNLENLYGTKESFEKTFNEAVRCNDSLQLYLETIRMLAECGKHTEMNEKISKVKQKYKQNIEMWLQVSKVYYLLKRFKDARSFKNNAIKSITDKKLQMNLIVRLAIIEFKYGEEEQAEAVFETILSSTPKKVNIWMIYVDQLVKKGKIDQARRILERAVSQKLPIRSMKTLFLKFRKFEEEHGTKDSLDVVLQRAKEYVTFVNK